MVRSNINTVVDRRQCAPHFYAYCAHPQKASSIWNLSRSRIVFALRSIPFWTKCSLRKFTTAEGGSVHKTTSFDNISLAHSTRVYSSSESGFGYLPVIGAIAVLSLAAGLYIATGRPDPAAGSSQPDVMHTVPTPAGDQDVSVASVESLLSGLEQRLQQEPEDGKGWLLLAKSYDHLGRTAEATAAYARARELGNSDLLLESRLVNTAFEGEPKTESLRN